MRLKSFKNDKGLTSLGQCCSGKQAPNGACLNSCKTRFHICLKNYQAEIDLKTDCTFGSSATHVIGENSFNLTTSTTTPSVATIETSKQSTINQIQHLQNDTLINPIGFPFEFLWPVSICRRYIQ